MPTIHAVRTKLSDQAVFAWGGPAAFRTAGSTSAVVHATIDVVVPANGTPRLTVDVPSTSGAGVLLLADTTATPGAITLTMP